MARGAAFIPLRLFDLALEVSKLTDLVIHSTQEGMPDDERREWYQTRYWPEAWRIIKRVESLLPKPDDIDLSQADETVRTVLKKLSSRIDEFHNHYPLGKPETECEIDFADKCFLWVIRPELWQCVPAEEWAAFQLPKMHKRVMELSIDERELIQNALTDDRRNRVLQEKLELYRQGKWEGFLPVFDGKTWPLVESLSRGGDFKQTFTDAQKEFHSALIVAEKFVVRFSVQKPTAAPRLPDVRAIIATLDRLCLEYENLLGTAQKLAKEGSDLLYGEEYAATQCDFGELGDSVGIVAEMLKAANAQPTVATMPQVALSPDGVSIQLFREALTELNAVIDHHRHRKQLQESPRLEAIPEVQSAAKHFVRCGHRIAGFTENLRKGAEYLTTATANGTEYDRARHSLVVELAASRSDIGDGGELLRQLLHINYAHPQNMSELNRCVELLAQCKNLIPLDSPIRSLIQSWESAALEVRGYSRLYATDGCRYLYEMDSPAEISRLFDRIESQLLDDIQHAAKKLAESVDVQLPASLSVSAGRADTSQQNVGRSLSDNPKVSELMLCLWNVPDREIGLPIAELPEHLQNEALMAACDVDELIEFGRRNHVFIEGGVHRRLSVETGWEFADLSKPGRKLASSLLREALNDDVSPEIRYHIRLTRKGAALAGKLLLDQDDTIQSAVTERPTTDSVVQSDADGPDQKSEFRQWGESIIRTARRERCIVALLASELWRDLRPNLLNGLLDQVSIDEILATGECKHGRDFPKDFLPAELEARKRLKELVPYIAGLGHVLADEDWKTIALQQGLFFDHDAPLDFDFFYRLRACLSAKVKSESPSANDTLKVSPPETPAGVSDSQQRGKRVKSKRSTQKGDGIAKCIAALTKWHRYADGSCMNTEPISVSNLYRQAEVGSKATASRFFNAKFGGPEKKDGHRKYKIVCRDASRLAESLRVLTGDFSPDELYGRRPPGEDHRDGRDE